MSADDVTISREEYNALVSRVEDLEKAVAKAWECAKFAYNLNNRMRGRDRKEINIRLTEHQHVAKKRDSLHSRQLAALQEQMRVLQKRVSGDNEQPKTERKQK